MLGTQRRPRPSVDDAGRGRLCWLAGFQAPLGRQPPNSGAVLRLAGLRWRTSLRAPAGTDTLTGQIGFCASNPRRAMLEPLSPSLQPHHSQLAQSSDSPLAGSSSAWEFPAQMLVKPSRQPIRLELHPKVQTVSTHPPPPLQHSCPFTTQPARLLEVLLFHAHPRRPAWPYFPHLCPISPLTPTQRFCFLRAWILLIFPLSPLHHPAWSLTQGKCSTNIPQQTDVVRKKMASGAF